MDTFLFIFLGCLVLSFIVFLVDYIQYKDYYDKYDKLEPIKVKVNEDQL